MVCKTFLFNRNIYLIFWLCLCKSLIRLFKVISSVPRPKVRWCSHSRWSGGSCMPASAAGCLWMGMSCTLRPGRAWCTSSRLLHPFSERSRYYEPCIIKKWTPFITKKESEPEEEERGCKGSYHTAGEPLEEQSLMAAMFCSFCSHGLSERVKFIDVY